MGLATGAGAVGEAVGLLVAVGDGAGPDGVTVIIGAVVVGAAGAPHPANMSVLISVTTDRNNITFFIFPSLSFEYILSIL